MLSKKSSFLILFIALCAVTIGLEVSAQERGQREMLRPERPQFSSLDLDEDGIVTYAEFEQSKVPNDDHAIIFGHIDADGDGEITEEEFTSHKPPERRSRN